jgi:dTDP-4-dehydrorhamnose reductase
MRVLVTGAAGRLGGRLVNILRERKHDVTGADIIGEGVEQIDITDFGQTCDFITGLQPDVVIHPAAWTDVDGCAREPDKAIMINGFGTQHVALGAVAAGAAMLHISTNEVFDGTAKRPYREYDMTKPINPYGYSKWVGERALMHVNPRHYIVRTAWLFAHGGKNFIQSVLAAAVAGKPLRVVTDEIGNPTYNDDLADAIAELIETGRYGVYHFVNEGFCSRYRLARYVLDRAGMKDTPVTPISSHEWPRPSKPPLFGAMENMAGKNIDITLRPWQEAVDAFMEREGLLKD